jgi:hypothetical protein
LEALVDDIFALPEMGFLAFVGVTVCHGRVGFGAEILRSIILLADHGSMGENQHG